MIITFKVKRAHTQGMNQLLTIIFIQQIIYCCALQAKYLSFIPLLLLSSSVEGLLKEDDYWVRLWQMKGTAQGVYYLSPREKQSTPASCFMSFRRCPLS